MGDLTGKVAVVTGGSRGIRLAIVEELVRAGCKVAAVATSQAGALASAPVSDMFTRWSATGSPVMVSCGSPWVPPSDSPRSYHGANHSISAMVRGPDAGCVAR